MQKNAEVLIESAIDRWLSETRRCRGVSKITLSRVRRDTSREILHTISLGGRTSDGRIRMGEPAVLARNVVAVAKEVTIDAEGAHEFELAATWGVDDAPGDYLPFALAATRELHVPNMRSIRSYVASLRADLARPHYV